MCEGLKIGPAPEEIGDEPSFRVVYMIDVNAGDVREAARYAHRIMTDPDSLRPVLHIIDSKGSVTEVDLSKNDAGNKGSGETANYDAAAQYLAYRGNLIFTGPMKGGLWHARCIDASVRSNKQGDRAAYEFLLKFGDQYASSLPADQRRQWQTIKEQAGLRLKRIQESISERQEEPAVDKFTKTTVGFVAQTFEKNDKDSFICTHQEFIAGDQCDYEDAEGNSIEPPDYEYQPYSMALKAEAARSLMLERAYEAIEEVLKSLDVGGEQSRQFAQEIQILRDVIGHQCPLI